MDEQPTLPAEVRASFQPMVQANVGFLESQVALFHDQVATLQTAVTKLQGQLADAKAVSSLDSFCPSSVLSMSRSSASDDVLYFA
jgi:hypothetical protein